VHFRIWGLGEYISGFRTLGFCLAVKRFINEPPTISNQVIAGASWSSRPLMYDFLASFPQIGAGGHNDQKTDERGVPVPGAWPIWPHQLRALLKEECPEGLFLSRSFLCPGP
jgi:hypothetical protein